MTGWQRLCFVVSVSATALAAVPQFVEWVETKPGEFYYSKQLEASISDPRCVALVATFDRLPRDSSGRVYFDHLPAAASEDATCLGLALFAYDNAHRLSPTLKELKSPEAYRAWADYRRWESDQHRQRGWTIAAQALGVFTGIWVLYFIARWIARGFVTPPTSRARTP